MAHFVFCTVSIPGAKPPLISKNMKYKVCQKINMNFGSKSVPKNQHKLHVFNSYICELGVDMLVNVVALGSAVYIMSVVCEFRWTTAAFIIHFDIGLLIDSRRS